MESDGLHRALTTKSAAMNRLLAAAAASIAVVMCAVLLGQAPGPNDASAPGFDISGYWTSPLQEDAMERGAGPELADYGRSRTTRRA
jgi:hypothetical protein